MTMPTIESRLRLGKSEAGARYQASRDDAALIEAARIQRAMSTDMPPEPTLKPLPGIKFVEVFREERSTPQPKPWQEASRATWRDVWPDIRGVVLCAAFVLTVLAFGAHVAGLWGA